MVPALELLGLTRDFPGTRALDAVSLSVARGEVFCYLGPNGAGKTTTIRILTGLLAPTEGDARVCGHSVRTESLLAKARLGYVPESGALFEKLTAREHVQAAARLYGVEEAEVEPRARRWLDVFGLLPRADQRLHTLSKGLRQRVCWASALAHEPDVLVLDEPLNGLDVEMVTGIKALIAELAAAGRAVFYSSHLVDVVEKLSTRVGVLHGGRLVATGTVEELLERSGATTLERALGVLWQRASAAGGG